MTTRDQDAITEDSGGTATETWILRGLLITVAALALSAVLASLDDIRRYARIKQM